MTNENVVPKALPPLPKATESMRFINGTSVLLNGYYTYKQMHAYASEAWNMGLNYALAQPIPAAPVAAIGPTIKQLAAQLDSDEKWTIAEQKAFAPFLAQFPNECSQGIQSLGSAWKHGIAYAQSLAAPQQHAQAALSDDEVLRIAAPFISDGEGFVRKPELFEIISFARAILAAHSQQQGAEPVADAGAQGDAKPAAVLVEHACLTKKQRWLQCGACGERPNYALARRGEKCRFCAIAAQPSTAQGDASLPSGAMQAMADAGFDVSVDGQKVQPQGDGYPRNTDEEISYQQGRAAGIEEAAKKVETACVYLGTKAERDLKEFHVALIRALNKTGAV